MNITPNAIYQADALALLERVDSDSVTLIYIDPPIFSYLNTAVFADSHDANSMLHEHLVYIGYVLQQARRILANSGSIYFHAEPVLAGNVRILLDQVFHRRYFRSEIIVPHTYSRRQRHDTIYVYSKTDVFIDNTVYRAMTQEELRRWYDRQDDKGTFRLSSLTTPVRRPNRSFSWRNYTPPPGQSWRFTYEKMEELANEDAIWFPSAGLPRHKVYLDEPVIEVGSIWDDIPLLQKSERVADFVAQRPLALLNRIVSMASNECDVVLDPFCGTGTALISAQLNNRQWIGCDSSLPAYSICTDRLLKTCELSPGIDYVCGDQAALESAAAPSDQSYERVFTGLAAANRIVFRVGQPVPLEEDRHTEFKEIQGGNAIRSIANAVDVYVVAMLNSEGGRILWGIRDDRAVVGVKLNAKERDELKRVVVDKLNEIRPAIDPTQYGIELHRVYEGARPIPDTWIIEITVPEVHSTSLYWASGKDAFVKTDSGKMKLTGPAIEDWIRRRLQE